MFTLEAIVTLYIIAILSVLTAPLVVIHARAAQRPARRVARPMASTYQGQLFTHPDEESCELTEATKHLALRIEGYTTEEEQDVTIEAPSNGWTHQQIAAHITFNKFECWDAYLGNSWIGSSEV